MGRLERKRVLVTGAATGIGRATAVRVASEGARVAMFDIKDSDADETLATITDSGSDARYWHVDVTAEDQVSGAVDEAADWLGGGIDVLTHLAGVQIGSGLDITDVDDAIWDAVVDINLKGSFIVVKHVARHMKAQRGGVIVLTSSGAGVLGPSSSFPYGASKGGVVQLTKALAVAWAEDNIQVNAVLPGWIATNMTSSIKSDFPERYRLISSRIPHGRWGEPDDLAGAAVFLASPASDYVTGVALPVDGGYTSF